MSNKERAAEVVADFLDGNVTAADALIKLLSDEGLIVSDPDSAGEVVSNKKRATEVVTEFLDGNGVAATALVKLLSDEGLLASGSVDPEE